MAFAKNEKGLEVDAAGNVVAEKYDKHVLPGDEDYKVYVPVVVDENSAHERLKEVAAENPDLEVEAGGNYLALSDEEVHEAGALGPTAPVAPPGSSADPASGRQGGTETAGLMDKVYEQHAENKAAAEKAAAEADADSAPAPAAAPAPAPRRPADQP